MVKLRKAIDIYDVTQVMDQIDKDGLPAFTHNYTTLKGIANSMKTLAPEDATRAQTLLEKLGASYPDYLQQMIEQKRELQKERDRMDRR